MRKVKNYIDLFIVLIATVVLIVPVLISTKGLMLRLDTDYDMNLPVYSYPLETLRKEKFFPFTNPYIDGGVSTVGDPQSPLFNPLFSIPLYIFGIQTGMKLVLFLVIFLSGVAMYYFLLENATHRYLRIWGALLYQFCGAITARFYIGHVEFFLVFPLIPIFFKEVIRSKINIVNSISLALIMTLTLFSGNVYVLWFFLIFLFTSIFLRKIFYKESLIKNISHLFQTFLLFLLFSSLKIFFFFKDVLPIFTKRLPPDPYSGSLHPYQTLLALIGPGLSWSQGPGYEWYEFYAFISPLPFLFILNLKNSLGNRQIKVIALFIILGFLYTSLGYNYSPFFWLFHLVEPLTIFRVPARMLMIITPLVIAFLVSCANSWIKTKRLILKIAVYGITFLTIVWTFKNSQKIIIMAYEEKKMNEELVAKELKARDASSFYVVNFAGRMQTYLIQEHIPVLDYWYGWRRKDTPNFIGGPEFFDFELLKNIKPKYVIVWTGKDLNQYGYQVFFRKEDITVWQTDLSNIFPVN